MRNYILLLVTSFLLAGCASAASPNPGAQPDLTFAPAASPKPTNLSLGECTDARQPTPAPNQASLFPPVSSVDHLRGPKDAYVTVLLYSDFQCASCAKLSAALKASMQKYPDGVRLVFRHFPLETLHDKAASAAQAAEAAGLQGKFWEMHDLLFDKQAEWQALKPGEFQKWLETNAKSLGLDMARFSSDLSSPAVTSTIQAAWTDGQKIKLPGAPVILINGEILKWQINLLDQLDGFISLALLPQRQFDTCPPVVIDLQKQYTAQLKTSRGSITIRLFADKAPNTVNNFIFLAQKGWFNNIPFHRVIPGFLVQTGDPSGTGLGGPGYFIPSEPNTALQYDRAGMVGMANSGPDTNGSQFFITLAPQARLNNDYPIFGQVTSGMEVLTALTPHNPADGSASSQPDTLISVTIEVH